MMTTRWQVKCIIDTVKGILPFQPSLRRLKDRIVGYRREPRKDKNTIEDGLLLLEWLGNIQGSTVLEIGTGWEPLIPILCSLAGAKVYMTDLHSLMRRDTFDAALKSLRESRDVIVHRMGISPDAVDRATQECDDFHQRLEELHLHYLAPCDCRHLDLNEGCIDIVLSRAVLEHVPPDVITEIFREGRRLLRPSGRMIHLVDHSDHWSHRDRRISAVNFLKYTDASFKWTCVNPQNYQNRLRHTEYVKAMESTGFVLIREEKHVDNASMKALEVLPIDGRFMAFPLEELATTDSIMLAQVSG